MIIGSKNKGDWSEFYTLLYLLATRRLYSADDSLRRLQNYYFPILKIFRNEPKTSGEDHIDFILTEPDGIKSVEIYVNGIPMRMMTSQEFQDEVDLLLKDIPSGQGRQFTIDHGERFLNSIFLKRLAAPSTDVTDIRLQVHDVNTGIEQNMGFSIKSYLGGAPTLLNASEATNFIYEVTGISSSQADEINAIEGKTKIIDRMNRIRLYGGELHFSGVVNNTFAGNLSMVDSKMDLILAEMLLHYFTSNQANCSDVVDYMEKKDPLNYNRENIYAYKFKKFLSAKALGMEPSVVWAGIDDANGGYITVKSDGEVLAYHLYNRDRLEQYLLDNTRFERASTSRHKYASIYERGNCLYMNLNLQIRFLDNH